MKKTSSTKMRIIHRYLGFFLAGIMAVYAISGIVLIFRKTDTFKQQVTTTEKVAPGLSIAQLEAQLNKKLEIDNTDGNTYFFGTSTYNATTGVITTKSMKHPFVLDKMTKLHMASTNSPLYFLNIFFGLSLLFFVISAFWMYMPNMPVLKKGLYFTGLGVALTLFLLFL